MNRLGKVDYHIHYHLDSCASEEMTFHNIEKTAMEQGLEEIAVLKHYSESLPNGKQDWVFWHCIHPEQFFRFLTDFENYRNRYGVTIYKGVETELINEDGDINIPISQQDSLDMIALSVHYMPDLHRHPMDLLHYPRYELYPPDNTPEGLAAIAEWDKKIQETGTEVIVQGFVNAYINALKRHSKIRTLAHMYDGLYPLETYRIPVDSVSENRLIELLEPLMQVAAQTGVLWELTQTPVKRPAILKRANELGVQFVATTDSHTLSGGWGNLTDHHLAEDYIDSLGLRKGLAF